MPIQPPRWNGYCKYIHVFPYNAADLRSADPALPVLHPNTPPPPHYYADNLLRLLRSVSQQYNDILLEEERAYLQRVSTLSVDAQRLYARLLTRKGLLIRVDSLDYREIEDLAQALAELEAAALLAANPPLPADQLLAVLTRAELDVLFPYVRGNRKAAQINAIAARYVDGRIRDVVAQRHTMCTTLGRATLTIMQLLFFGDARADLSTFVLEDLGMVRFESYTLDPQHRQFRDRAELDDILNMHEHRALLRLLEARWDPAAANHILMSLWDRRDRRGLERVRGGLINQLGRCAERAGAYDLALSIYGRASRAPGRERQTRLLSRLGDAAGALTLLDAIERAPLSAGERHFAQRFRLGRRSRLQRVAERVLRLPEPPTAGVEAAALAALTRNCGVGRHLENLASLGMLGLAFWDIVFAPVDGAFVNPYQQRPLDLYWSDFRRPRAAMIAARLTTLAEPDAMARQVGTTVRTKCGISNALVDWRALDIRFIRHAVNAVPSATWIAIFDHMLYDLEQARTGFPDLTLCFGHRSFQFVEVKGPGDQLRREQQLWFDFFAKADIAASVLRVEW